uniref:Uncharacterized protein n=1 Tax=Cacopsylla melanoneura TaxID=428564 RepID=A0A8D8RFU6_9HEMI
MANPYPPGLAISLSSTLASCHSTLTTSTLKIKESMCAERTTTMGRPLQRLPSLVKKSQPFNCRTKSPRACSRRRLSYKWRQLSRNTHRRFTLQRMISMNRRRNNLHGL